VDNVEQLDLFFKDQDLTLFIVVIDHKLLTVRSKDIRGCG
jgi:hypothetical protein